MRIYLIDAFNLVHAIPTIRDSATPRADLVRFFSTHRLTGSRTNRAVLVFDGYPAEGVENEGSVEVLFSKNRTADDVIADVIAKTPHKRQIVVVSDDRAVRSEASAQGAETIANAVFLARGKKEKRAPASKRESIDEDSQRRITEELAQLWTRKG